MGNLNLCSSYKQHMIPLALLALSAVQLCTSLPYYSRDGPLGMEELNMLHADAVKFGAASENVWFKAIDAATLDSLITEMNEMNRWFAKVVKYWDDFTSGGDGSNVLAENGPGIQKMPKNAEGAETETDEAAEGADAGGDDAKAAESETDAAAADAEPPADAERDKDAPAEDGAAAEGEAPAAADEGGEEAPKEGEEEAAAEGDKAAEGEAPAGEEPAEADAAAADDKAAAADPPAEAEGEAKEDPPAARRKRMRRMG